MKISPPLFLQTVNIAITNISTFKFQGWGQLHVINVVINYNYRNICQLQLLLQLKSNVINYNYTKICQLQLLLQLKNNVINYNYNYFCSHKGKTEVMQSHF